MVAATVIARLILVAVFGVAAAAKLADRSESRRAIVNFGVPEFLAGPIGIILPLAELGCAVALIPDVSAQWGAWGAIGLLTLFSAAVSASLARGRSPDCRCFGRLHARPVSWSTLARNAALVAMAGFVAAVGPANAGGAASGWLAGRSASTQAAMVGDFVILAFVGLQGLLLLNLFLQNGRLLVRIEALENGQAWDATRVGQTPPPLRSAPPGAGLPVGNVAPEFSLPGLDGETTTLAALRAAGRPVMLIFTDPGCGPCEAMMPDVGRWQERYRDRLTIAVISRGDLDANRGKARQFGLHHVLLQRHSEVAEDFRFEGTPSAVVIGADGSVATPLVAGADGIRGLLSRAVEEPRRIPVAIANGNGHHSGGGRAAVPPVPALRQPAPSVALADLDGVEVDLRSFRGRSVVVLFWNPSCGFCQQMIGDLQEWEHGADEGCPGLLVVSNGSPDTTRALELKSPVVLDGTGQTMQRYGATGTPMAVLVDGDGLVASNLAVGRDAVLALLAERAGN